MNAFAAPGRSMRVLYHRNCRASHLGSGRREKHGLVHRDLKPANLMLVKADDPEVMGSDHAQSKRSRIRALRKSGIPVVKIIDFGLAKAFHTATDPKSLTHGRFVGTPAFASPEQFGTFCARRALRHLLAGRNALVRAYRKNAIWQAVAWRRFTAHNNQMPLPVEQLKAAHVPHRLKSLLESMLAFEPASRPGTRELAARLQRCSPEATQRATHARCSLSGRNL